jgi:mycofactocin precursor
MSNTLSPTAIPQAQPARHAAKHAAQREDTEATAAPAADTRDVIEADELVEEISIDGMCGVY